MTFVAPNGPGVQVTLKLVAVALVAGPQTPPAISTNEVNGKLVPLSVNAVVTPGGANAGTMPVIAVAPASAVSVTVNVV